jgi:hypothetical protein
MLPLRDLQTVFRLALVGDDPSARDTLRDLIADGEPAADARIDVYRNNVFASLTDALKETFPAVCRLVDERFFSYAAHEFIANRPPRRPSLMEYGSAFPDFLAEFPACRELHYLADVARFEWLMNVAAHAPDAAPASLEALASIAPDDAARLLFRLHPSYHYLASPFPIDAIWRANRSCAGGDAAIDLDAGGVRLEVSREGGDVVFRKLDEPVFAFRQALAGGALLGEALERTLSIDPEFSATEPLMTLFAEGAVATVTLPALTEHAQ